MNNNKKKIKNTCQNLSPSTDAGNFSIWLQQIKKTFTINCGIEVPCGDCRGCCRSSQFIHIKPHETEAFLSIPKDLLFHAPMTTDGTMMFGYNEHGECPMLTNGNCSIYEKRPLTCKNFDCRIFTAADIKPEKRYCDEILKKVKKWQFIYTEQKDRDLHTAVKKTASFIMHNVSAFPNNNAPLEPTQVAIVALKSYKVFLHSTKDRPKDEIANEIINATHSFKN